MLVSREHGRWAGGRTDGSNDEHGPATNLLNRIVRNDAAKCVNGDGQSTEDERELASETEVLLEDDGSKVDDRVGSSTIDESVPVPYEGREEGVGREGRACKLTSAGRSGRKHLHERQSSFADRKCDVPSIMRRKCWLDPLVNMLRFLITPYALD